MKFIKLCPQCNCEVPIEEEVRDFSRKLESKTFEASQKELELEREKARVGQAEALKAERKRYAVELEKSRAEIQEQAREAAAAEQEKLIQRQAVKLEIAQKKAREYEQRGLALMSAQEEVAEKERVMNLEIAKAVSEKTTESLKELEAKLTVTHELKVKELELQLGQMKRQALEMNQTGSRGSQQIQGEALELSFEALMKRSFPHDNVVEISKGVRGGDYNLEVRLPSGAVCGSIHVECKNAKKYEASWPKKAKDDTDLHKCDLTVIVSQSLPKDILGFGYRDDVHITAPEYSVALITCLREQLMQTYKSKRAESVRKDEKDMVFNFLVGNEFRRRFTKIVETHQALMQQLHKERAAASRTFAQRESSLSGLIEDSAHLFGGLQGVIGVTSFPDIAALALLEHSAQTEMETVPAKTGKRKRS